ncbi:MAG TPA: hypothetical protein VFP27_02605, partial [Mycobacterium sp.]|nr:hypothetical protein [Mycobacterium sp.]
MTKAYLVPLLLPADPTAPLEAATKQYVDNNAGGGTALVWQTEAPTDTSVLWADTDEPAGATRIVTHPETALTA